LWRRSPRWFSPFIFTGIRRISDWANSRYGLRAGVIEAILILALTLLAAPLRGWLERRFRALFERETALYASRANVGAHAGRYRRLSELVAFIESQTASALSLRRVKIALHESEDVDSRKRFLMRRVGSKLS